MVIDRFPDEKWRHIPRPFTSLASIIHAHGHRRPEELAMADGKTSRTWQALSYRVNATAKWLLDAGVEPGDRVALLSGNSIPAYEAVLAAIHIGAVPAPLSPLLSADVLGRLIRDCAPKHAILAAPIKPLWLAATESIGLDIPCTCLENLDQTSEDGPPLHRASMEDPSMLFYSSGTTGVPKGIVLTNLSRLWTANAMASGLRFTSQSRSLVTTPPFTNGSWLILLPAFFSGTPVFLQPKFDPEPCLELMREKAITHSFFVPTQLHILSKLDGWDSNTLSALQMVLSAGAPMPSALAEHLHETIPGKLFELWGLTEGVATIASPSDLRARPGTCGRPTGDADIRIVGEDGIEQAVGEVGEIVGHSLGLMSGYLGDGDVSQDRLWVSPEGRTFLRTGDIGQFDDDGFLYIRGRQKEMIVSGGLNIYPADIEARLIAHPEIKGAAVVGVPHEKWGETPVAFVITEPQSGLSRNDILSWAETRLERFQRLNNVVIVQGDFPRNALGKVLKNNLRETYLQEVSCD